MKRLLGGLKRSRPSFQGHHEEEERDEPESPEIEASQQVVWDDSPPSYKPLTVRDSKALVQKELSLLQGILGHQDKHDGGAGFGDHLTHTPHGRGSLAPNRPRADGSAPNSLLRSFLNTRSPAPVSRASFGSRNHGENGLCPPPSPLSNQNAPGSSRKRARPLQPLTNQLNLPPTTPGVSTKKEMITPGGGLMGGPTPSPAPPPRRSFFGDLARITQKRIKLPKIWGGGGGAGEESLGETPQAKRSTGDSGNNGLLTILDKIEERLSQGTGPALSDEEEEEEEEEPPGGPVFHTAQEEERGTASLKEEEPVGPSPTGEAAGVLDLDRESERGRGWAAPMPPQGRVEVQVKESPDSALARSQVAQAQREERGAGWLSRQGDSERRGWGPQSQAGGVKVEAMQVVKQQPPPSPVKQRQPWDKDDDELYTEDEWALILDGIPEEPAPQPPQAAPQPTRPVVKQEVVPPSMAAPAPLPPKPAPPLYQPRQTQPTQPSRPLPPPQSAPKYMPSQALAPPPSQPLPTALVPPSPSEYDASGPTLLTSTPPEPQAPTSFPYARFEILGVSERRPNGDILCDVRDKVSRREGSLCVREDWSQCDLRPGDVVHVVWTCNRRIEVPGHVIRGGDTRSGQPRPIGPIDQPDRVVCSVDNRHNYLIVHPDVLVTPSSIMAAVECDRRAVLQERVQSSAAYSVAATMGNLKHEITQELLSLLNQGPPSLARLMDGSIVGDVERCIEAVLTRQSVTLLALHIPYAQARRDLMDLIRPLVDWARRCYLRPKGSQFATTRQVNKKDFMEVHGAPSIEESIWSASLGLKGKIDATLEITSRDADMLPVKEGALVPLELKSGFKGRDNVIRHKAQVLVYSLLLADRYGATALSLTATDGLAAQLPPGVLAYVSPKEMDDTVILPNEAELRALLIARNRLARALKETDLPPVLFNSHACSRCFNVAECMTYQRALEPDNPSRGDPEMAALIDLMSGSMDATDAEFLRKWDRLISLEAAASGGGLRDTWHRPAAQVEHLTSRCLSDMVLVSHRVSESSNGPLHVYSFCRRKWASHQALSQCENTSSIPRSLLELSIASGDRLLISTESCLGDGPPSSSPTQAHPTTLLPFRHVNVAVGNVTALTESTVEISCPKAMALPYVKPPAKHRRASAGEGLRLGYEPPTARPQTHRPPQAPQPQGDFCASLLRAPQAAASTSTSTSTSPLPRGAEHVIFRLDADSSVLNFSLMRGNLMQLFTAAAHNANANNPAGGGLKLAPSPGDDKRRRLIVHLMPPTFAHPPTGTQTRSPILCSTLLPPPGCDPAALRQEYQSLNEDQREALEKVLAARDYALLLGMPGTGKTSTIGFVVRALVCRGKRVLITSYTHSAVDNLLLKLREKGVHFLRLGRPSQVNPALHDSVLDPSNCNEPSMDHLEKRLNNVQVIATTCLGVRHPLLLRWRFDYCIVDEAGQIALPVCLGPLRFADTFVLVGDDNQLPPLVLSSEAREGGMGESLFTRLSRAHPPAVARLSHQYRMNHDIMSICNTLVYDNMLKCGDDARVGRARLAVPRLDRLRMLRPPNHPPSWLEDILRPNRCVVFLNTDNLLASEQVEEGEEQQLVSLEKGLVPNSDRECSSNLTNPTEARLVCQVVTGMLLAGVKPEAVAVISPLRAQLKLLRREMGHLRRVEVNTVDKYQGSDRDCIILSLVRSNSEGKIGELLRDRRRINVAVSRAKRKLILVGSKRTLMQGDVFKDLIGHLSSRGWILDLPPGGHELYQEKDVDVLCEVAWTESPN